MTPERWQEIDKLLELALEQEPSRWAEFLDKWCIGDFELRQEVEALLAAHAQAGSFIEAPALEAAAQATRTEHAGSFLSSPASEVTAGLTEARPLLGRSVGPYQILSLLGAGGMGEVYLAQDSRLGRRIALKFLPAEFTRDHDRLRRFEREARAVSALNHPNILTIHEIGEHDGSTFIATEFIDGQTLRQKMTDRQLELREALDIVVQVTGALAAAHEAAIIHRDIKPENIMVRRDGYVKVLDFGLAKLTESGTAPAESQDLTRALSATETGMVMGTTRYMSPEQARGVKVDERTDLFSLGVVIYEMVTGRVPFEGETATDVIIAIVEKEPQPLSSLCAEAPDGLEQIVSRSLAKDREQRYPTAKDLLTDLKRLKQQIELERAAGEREKGIGERNEPDGERGKAKGERDAVSRRASRNPFAFRFAALASVSRRRWLFVLAGLVVVLLVVIGLDRLWRPSGKPPEMAFRQLTTNSSEIPVEATSISPDGKYLAYADQSGLLLKIIQTGETHILLKPEGGIGALAWFPDGNRLLLVDHGQKDTNHLLVTSILGGAPKKLREHVGSASVSSDGSRIAFTTDSNSEIWSMGANGEEPARVIAKREGDFFSDVTWSPTGERLAYRKLRAPVDQWEPSIETCDLKGGKVSSILSGKRLYGVGSGTLWWTSDGRVLTSLLDPSTIGSPPLRDDLWEIKADSKTGRASSAPRQIAHWPDFSFGQGSVTVDGKRLAFLNRSPQAAVYLAEFETGGKRLKTPRRLTLSKGFSNTASWTADGKAVLFDSNRNGSWAIYKQDISQVAAEEIVAGRHPRLSPDGSWVLYDSLSIESPHMVGPELSPNGSWMVNVVSFRSTKGLMRVPVEGGPPQVVGKDSYDYCCARAPSSLCVYIQALEKRLIFSAFDPLKGPSSELFRIVREQSKTEPEWAGDPGPPSWTLSPDGLRIALDGEAKSGGLLRILSLKGELLKEMHTGFALGSLNWSSDGKGIYVSSDDRLLRVGLDGAVDVLIQSKNQPWTGSAAIPSPDGKYLALKGKIAEANVWMIENF